jgi:hypothetical protein
LGRSVARRGPIRRLDLASRSAVHRRAAIRVVAVDATVAVLVESRGAHESALGACAESTDRRIRAVLVVAVDRSVAVVVAAIATEVFSHAAHYRAVGKKGAGRIIAIGQTVAVVINGVATDLGRPTQRAGKVAPTFRVVTIGAFIAVVVYAVAADLGAATPTDRIATAVPVVAVGEPVAIVVATIPTHFRFTDAEGVLAANRIAAISEAVTVIVGLIGAGFGDRNALLTEGLKSTLEIIAVGQAVAVVVEAVEAVFAYIGSNIRIKVVAIRTTTLIRPNVVEVAIATVVIDASLEDVASPGEAGVVVRFVVAAESRITCVEGTLDAVIATRGRCLKTGPLRAKLFTVTGIAVVALRVVSTTRDAHTTEERIALATGPATSIVSEVITPGVHVTKIKRAIDAVVAVQGQAAAALSECAILDTVAGVKIGALRRGPTLHGSSGTAQYDAAGAAPWAAAPTKATCAAANQTTCAASNDTSRATCTTINRASESTFGTTA